MANDVCLLSTPLFFSSSSSSPPSFSHATDVFLSRFSRQESTGKTKASVLPMREEYKAPGLRAADAGKASPSATSLPSHMGDFRTRNTSSFIHNNQCNQISHFGVFLIKILTSERGFTVDF